MPIRKGRAVSDIRNLIVGNIIPVGFISPFSGSVAPKGWLLCSGGNVSRTIYSSLFSVISTTYGAGDGINTFGIPDLRGRTPLGKDDMGGTAANRITSAASGINGTVLGSAGGSQTHTLTVAQIPLHGHASRHCDDTQGNGDGGLMIGNQISVANFPAFTGTLSNVQGQQITGAGSSTAHQNTQPSIIINYIIKV